MKKLTPSNGRREIVVDELRATKVNGRSVILPSDPHEAVKVLRAKRAKGTAATRAKERLAAEQAKRGL